MREKWGSYNIEGWGAFFLKEKLKLIKGSLKECHQRHSQNLIGKCNTVKERMSILYIKGETYVLDEEKANGVQVQGVKNICSTIFNHFSSHFRHVDGARPGVDNLNFCKLSVIEAASLICFFTVEKVKQAIWDCDNFKSLGPDGISFGFIKQFWNDLKDAFMRFVSEFHRNGRLTKGINANIYWFNS